MWQDFHNVTDAGTYGNIASWYTIYIGWHSWPTKINFAINLHDTRKLIFSIATVTSVEKQDTCNDNHDDANIAVVTKLIYRFPPVMWPGLQRPRPGGAKSIQRPWKLVSRPHITVIISFIITCHLQSTECWNWRTITRKNISDVLLVYLEVEANPQTRPCYWVCWQRQWCHFHQNTKSIIHFRT
jgi:hypothetical protein